MRRRSGSRARLCEQAQGEAAEDKADDHHEGAAPSPPASSSASAAAAASSDPPPNIPRTDPLWKHEMRSFISRCRDSTPCHANPLPLGAAQGRSDLEKSWWQNKGLGDNAKAKWKLRLTGPPIMQKYGSEGVWIALTLTNRELRDVKKAHGQIVLLFLLHLSTNR